MKTVLPSLPILMLGFCCSCLAQSDHPIIKNVRLFDGENVIENATILTENGIITDIQIDRTRSYSGKNVIDGTGYTLIPGLINSHVHSSRKKNLRQAARSGVLSLLDLLNSPSNASKLRALRGTPGLAYYYSSGPSVTIPGGHGSREGVIPSVNGISQTPQFVKDRLAEGSDYIKIILERGTTSKPIPFVPDEMLVLAANTANEEKVVSVAHISERAEALKAANFGVSGLAHIWIKDSTEISDQEILILKDRGVFIIPTLYVYKRGVEATGWRIDIEMLKRDLFKIYAAGIPVLAGTDSPNFEINYGDDLIKELELLVESGMSEIDALRSATSIPSISFRLGQNGFIRKGFSADFVLINGNPTKNIKDLNNIHGIWKMGEFIRPHNRR